MTNARETAHGLNLVQGSALRMDEVSSESVSLIVTSPPYFSDVTRERLRQPERAQTDFDVVSEEATAFALRLRPAFTEMARTLQPGGHLVVQTKDLRYGGALIPVSGLHRSMADAAGFRLVTRVLWENAAEAPHHGSRARQAKRLSGDHIFRTVDTEDFWIFVKPGGPERGGEANSFDADAIDDLVSPLWRMSTSRSWHPEPSPPAVVDRLIRLLSQPGDLVLDPFAGSGTILRVAKRLRRETVGYEIDRAYWERALELADE